MKLIMVLSYRQKYGPSHEDMMFHPPTYCGHDHGERSSTHDENTNKIHQWEWRVAEVIPKFDLEINGQVVAKGISRKAAAKAAGKLLMSKRNDSAKIRQSQPPGEWFLVSE